MFGRQIASEKYTGYETKGRYGVLCRINDVKGVYPLHRHDYIEIEYLVQGEIKHEINGHQSVLSTGDCWCLDERDAHMFTVDDGGRIHNICIDLKTVPEVVRKFLMKADFPMVGRIDREAIPTLDRYFFSLKKAVESEESYPEEKIASYLLLVLTIIFEKSKYTFSKPVSSSYEHIVSAIVYMEENCSQPITLADTARAVHISANHLSQLFPKISGSTFINQLNSLRIKKAKNMLANTNVPVTYIAFECGFGSFSSFSRTFKKEVGVTPSTYRERKIRKGEFLSKKTIKALKALD